MVFLIDLTFFTNRLFLFRISLVYMGMCTHACTFCECVSIRIPCVVLECSDTTLATRMAHGMLREFDPSKESIEDFRERYDFYCLANNIRGEGEAAVSRKKALFLTLVGQAAFAKLKTLASPRPISELTLDEIMEHLVGHYRLQTIEIAERFKFFKRHQLGGESTVEFMSELRRLAKTCNFGDYLESAIRD